MNHDTDELTPQERAVLIAIFEARSDLASWSVLARQFKTSTGRMRYFYRRAEGLHLRGLLYLRVAA